VVVIVATVFVSVILSVTVTVSVFVKKTGETGLTTNEPPVSGPPEVGHGTGTVDFWLPVACVVARDPLPVAVLGTDSFGCAVVVNSMVITLVVVEEGRIVVISGPVGWGLLV
jgi:hypothetical protein